MIKYLKPYKTDSPKIRLGSNRDGGYVASEIAFEKCDSLIAYGYGGLKDYEDDFANKFNKPVYLFDHTVGDSKWTEGLVNFYPEGLGPDKKDLAEMSYYTSQLNDNVEGLNKVLKSLQENPNTNNLKKSFKALDYFQHQLLALNNVISLKGVREHYNSLKLNGKVFLKIDTEGAEYEYFYNTDIKDLASFVTGMTIEFHHLEQPPYQTKLGIIMEKFKEHFILTHIHGNNWGGETQIGDFTIPRVLELSFLNKEYATNIEIDNSSYPLEGLDFPNDPSSNDCNLDFLNQI